MVAAYFPVVRKICETMTEKCTFFCPICMESKQVDLLITLPNCGCTFCQPCLSSYVSTRLYEQLATSFPCPSYQCEGYGLVPDTELERLLSPSEYKRYLDHRSIQSVRTNPTLTFCPAIDCGAICTIRVPSTDNLPKPERSRSTINDVMHRLWSRCYCSMRQSRVPETGLPATVLSHDVDPTFLSNCLSEALTTSPPPSSSLSPRSNHHQPLSSKSPPPVRVACSSCGHVFCSRCHMPWHSNGSLLCRPVSQRRRKRSDKVMTKSTPLGTQRRGPLDPSSTSHRLLMRKSERLRTGKRTSGRLGTLSAKMSDNTLVDLSVLAVGFPPYPPDAWLKRCPACLVPIERVDGCAQMMCRSCRHTFCWHCLASLDNDFLLHHFDVGACKGKLGHSRASVLGHRVYVVSVLTGLTLLFLVTAPFVIISLPCILCAKCHYLYRRHRLRKRHSNGLLRPQETVVSNGQQSDKPTELESPTPDHKCYRGSAPGDSAGSAVPSSGAFILAETADIHWCSLSTPGTSSEPTMKQDSTSSAPDAT